MKNNSRRALLTPSSVFLFFFLLKLHQWFSIGLCRVKQQKKTIDQSMPVDALITTAAKGLKQSNGAFEVKILFDNYGPITVGVSASFLKQLYLRVAIRGLDRTAATSSKLEWTERRCASPPQKKKKMPGGKPTVATVTALWRKSLCIVTKATTVDRRAREGRMDGWMRERWLGEEWKRMWEEEGKMGQTKKKIKTRGLDGELYETQKIWVHALLFSPRLPCLDAGWLRRGEASAGSKLIKNKHTEHIETLIFWQWVRAMQRGCE